MLKPHLIHHAPGAPGLRLLGLGPQLKPTKGLLKLQKLFNEHAFWAKKRKIKDLKNMLINSSVIISLWQNERIVGFGRATSDKTYRAVLWDVVIANDLQGLGFGRILVDALVNAPSIKNVERIYLMTTKSSDLYQQMNFKLSDNQSLLLLKNKTNI